MNDSMPQLKSAPIVEAVLDIDCDLPPGIDVATLEAKAQQAFLNTYPKLKKQLIQETQFETKIGETPKVSTRHGLQAFQFLSADEKQLVQVRPQGYSFNRLAPYSSLDDYLAEIERTWTLFVNLTEPVQTRLVRLRFINRILLPTRGGNVELNDYLRLTPRLPDETKLVFSGFFNQNSATEPATGNAVSITMATEPMIGDKLPIILDIEAHHAAIIEPNDWTAIASRIQSLRVLKNMVFRNSLTDSCLNLFQQ